ncbi:MarR family transcriptional regulator [Pedobacter sp. MR2016-19]|uniref:helix-turn-helix domain-containing protein n=1 Tax=Pedobacter sp. MR2016-19 TaxID=2780089 RepID=UPI001876245F|nr:helix-turn-helix domain-containing protein [Pedobacter sp. MR2016-19]MBE5318263.1 MarR family transcriptional regulator [Pedobacter sp. MR2016-19]
MEKLLVGRSGTANYLADTIESIAIDGNNQQLLIIGQRGMGKTHLLRVLYSKAIPYIDQHKLFVAYFSEEEYGVSNYFDFLIRILYAFIRWNGGDKEILEKKIEELHSVSISGQANYAEKIIQDYIGEVPLLILAENFADILNGIGKSEQSKLRAWLYRNQRVSIIATSQAISDDFDDEDRPFFEFFNIYYLKPLTYEESFDFLVSIAELDGRPDVVTHLRGKGQSQVRAIHDLVKGNHRLLVTFYEFLKSNTLAKLSNHFIKTINDLKPYYETFIRYLPPQQQKIVRFVALSRKPQQGTDIAKNCFIDQKSLSKQLSELVRKRLLEAIVDSSDKRNRLYDIDEPLLRISIEVGEHKEGITALFIDFLALYYNEDELKDKLNKISDLFLVCENQNEKRDFEYEISALQQALEQKNVGGETFNDPLQRLLNIASEAIDKEDYKKGILLFEQELVNWQDVETNYLYYSLLINLLILNREFERASEIFKKLDEEIISEHRMYTNWGMVLANIAKQKRSAAIASQGIEKFVAAEKNNEISSLLYCEWGNTVIWLSVNKTKDESYKEGVVLMEKAISLEPDSQYFVIELAKTLLTMALKLRNKEYALRSLQLFEKVYGDDPLNPSLYQYWGASITLASLAFEIPTVHAEIFKTGFEKLDSKQRLKAWKMFAQVSYYNMISLTRVALLGDLTKKNKKLISYVVEWYISILSRKNVKLLEDELLDMKNIIKEATKETQEMVMLEIYIDTFITYKIKGDEKAVYNLPKEQRLFFLEKIIKNK